MDRLYKGHYFYINMSSIDRNATMLPFGITVAFLYGCFFTAPSKCTVISKIIYFKYTLAAPIECGAKGNTACFTSV